MSDGAPALVVDLPVLDAVEPARAQPLRIASRRFYCSHDTVSPDAPEESGDNRLRPALSSRYYKVP